MNISALHFVEILNINGDCNGRLHGCHGYTLKRVVHLVKMFKNGHGVFGLGKD